MQRVTTTEPPDGRSPDFAGAARTLSRLGRLLERVPAPLSAAQFRVAGHVAAGEEQASRVAGALALAKPTVTQAVDSLVNAGLLLREPQPGDRRCVRLVLTDSGRAALAATEAAYAERLAQLCRPPQGPALDPGSTAALLRGLAAVGEVLDAQPHGRAR